MAAERTDIADVNHSAEADLTLHREAHVHHRGRLPVAIPCDVGGRRRETLCRFERAQRVVLDDRGLYQRERVHRGIRIAHKPVVENTESASYGGLSVAKRIV